MKLFFSFSEESFEWLLVARKKGKSKIPTFVLRERRREREGEGEGEREIEIVRVRER